MTLEFVVTIALAAGAERSILGAGSGLPLDIFVSDVRKDCSRSESWRGGLFSGRAPNIPPLSDWLVGQIR